MGREREECTPPSGAARKSVLYAVFPHAVVRAYARAFAKEIADAVAVYGVCAAPGKKRRRYGMPRQCSDGVRDAAAGNGERHM